MDLEFKIGQLKNSDDWKELAITLGSSNRLVPSIFRHLIDLNVKSYMTETHYIDRDYSSDYRRFYAQTFRPYKKHCLRVHFFADDIEALMAKPSLKERITALQGTSNSSYLGFCVVRPLPRATIGRTVLKGVGPSLPDIESVITCRAKVRANLLGAQLDVIGTAFMQQDSRVGACAQVAIWVGARHMYQRYGYNWLSVADITKLASPNTSDEASALPAGSDFLTSDRMINAINEMGFQPLCFQGGSIRQDILPYVESGLPVILGLQQGNLLGHAVTVIGRVFGKSKKPTNKIIDYIPAYIVHDDQAGPYMLVPADDKIASAHGFDTDQITKLVNHPSGGVSVDLTMKDAVFAVALMPNRVFSTAKAAEILTQGKVFHAMQNIDKIRKNFKKKKFKIDDRLLDEFIDAHKSKKMIFRTYLSSASGYRHHLAYSSANDELKKILLGCPLPHFIWVTEIFTVDSYNHSSASMRRIYGHCILDATSTAKDSDSVLMLHLPGVVFLGDADAQPGQAEKTVPIMNDAIYECREKRNDH